MLKTSGFKHFSLAHFAQKKGTTAHKKGTTVQKKGHNHTEKLAVTEEDHRRGGRARVALWPAGTDAPASGRSLLKSRCIGSSWVWRLSARMIVGCRPMSMPVLADRAADGVDASCLARDGTGPGSRTSRMLQSPSWCTPTLSRRGGRRGGRGRRGARKSSRRLLFLVVDAPVPFSDKFQQSKVRLRFSSSTTPWTFLLCSRDRYPQCSSQSWCSFGLSRCARVVQRQVRWFDCAANCGCSAVAFHRRSSTSFSFRRGRSPWSRLLSRPQSFPSCRSFLGGRCPCCAGRADSPVPPWR